ncbi:DUF1016 N-terminal domain-containing protein [Adlercreutzia sp. ZJ138]|uniref:DUF1016 N-terminal domain-containing protein n=1 Tax=Adlercreutzia sp. ZJ138 TaxID=2709405 RepID=UPI00351B648B
MVGCCISKNTRNGKWGTGAIEAISENLHRELPGLKGFSVRSLYYMRTYYEEWSSCFSGVDASISALSSAEMKGGLRSE